MAGSTSFFENLGPEMQETLVKAGWPRRQPPAVPPQRVVVKKGSEPPPAPTTTPSPTPAPATTNPIEALKAQVSASIAKGATPYEAWCRVRYEHPQLVQQARQIPITKAIEAPTERQQDYALLKSVTAGLVKDGVVPDQLAALRYLAAEAPQIVQAFRRGEVPR